MARLTRKQRRAVLSKTPKTKRQLVAEIQRNPECAERLCSRFATFRMRGPLTPEERALSDEIVAQVTPCDWYHGGISGLCAGDVLLPPCETGLDPRGRANTSQGRQASVFFTWHLNIAAKYAARIPSGGAVYRIEPIGTVICDPQDVRRLLLLNAYVRSLRDERGQIDFSMCRAFAAPRASILEIVT